MRDRVLSVFLCLVLAFGLISTAFPGEAYASEDGADYSIPMDTDSLTSYDSRYTVRIYSSIPMSECMVGDVIELRCELLDAGGKPTAWSNPSIVVENDDIVSLSAYLGFLDINDGFSFKVKGTAEGQTDITVTDSKSGAYATVTLTFGSDPTYRIDQVPDGAVDELWAAGPTQTNFYDVNGLYVNGFSQSYDEKTDKYSVTFSVFNSTYMNGAVDIYNAEGKWIESKKINKVTGAHSIKDTFEDGWNLSADLFAGKGLSYTLSSSTEETQIKFSVPNGGYFTISNNYASSPGTYLYNMIDFIVLSASSITDAAIGVITDTTKITNLTSVMEDKLFDLSDVTDDLVGEMRSYATKALTSAGEYNMSQFADVSVCSFEEFLNTYNIDLEKIVGAELGIAESVFKRLTGPIGNVLSLLFTGSKYGDYLTQTISLSASSNNPIIKIFATEERYTEAAKSISDTAEMDRAVFQVFQITFEKIIFGTNEQEWQDATYRIRLIPREKETDSEVVSVMLPRPSWFNGTTCIVKRLDIFGNTELESKVGTSFISFKTDYSSGIIPDGSKKKPEKVLLAVNEYDGNNTLTSQTRYEYDENGLLTRSVTQSYGAFPRETVYDYTYDDQGRLLQKSESDLEDYPGVFVRKYDSNGDLLLDGFIGAVDMWTESEYAYNEEGQIVHAAITQSYPGVSMAQIANEFSYNYHKDEQGNFVAVRHCENNSALEDAEFIYDVEGRVLQDYDEYWSAPIRYEYIDDPYFCMRDERETYDANGNGQIVDNNWRVAYILDNAGREIESFTLGAPETVQMSYDEDGYLAQTDDTGMYSLKYEFIYGQSGEEPNASAPVTVTPAPEKESMPPLAYENRTKHHELVTSDGVLTGTSDLIYPYFTDGSQMAGMLNKSIGAILDQRRNAEMDPESEGYFGEMVAQGMPLSTDDVEITVTYNADGLLSLLYRYTFYNTGGAHAYTSYEGQIYDTSTGRQLNVQDLAGSRYSQMCDCLAQTASGQGISRGTPERAEACVLSEEGASFYYNVGAAVPQEVVTVPFTLEYFDRAPIDNTTTVSESTGSNQAAATTLTVTGNGVNIRSGPGTGYESIGSVNKGDKLFSKGKSNNWYMVEYGNTTGYIIEDYVTIEHGGFYTVVDSGTLSVNGTDVNIRSGPGTEYQSIGKVSRGTTLTITGKSDNWYQVSYNGGTGYIIEDYVTK